ncbi:hypothetical protein BD410DRAFT_787066 [Rickenella mellea]|uniref:Malate dehydrogenase n=1 Tax=Rickenella mellea TaxID=50990 RepID=A0A4Y7Q8L2_9AGAM|nr:hypothetical protein BD410DRAFT_787066 [Rickenella mellea]
MFGYILTAAMLLPFSNASPYTSTTTAMSNAFHVTGCDVSGLTPNLPSGQTQLTVPTGTKPVFVALGVGVQNYTCGSTGTYASAGAVAEFFDLSCFVSQRGESQLQTIIFNLWNGDKSLTVDQLIKAFGTSKIVLGQHYFVTNPVTGTGISPEFDFRTGAKKGDPNGFVIAAKSGDIVSPDGPTNVDWLELTNVKGDLAKQVFRIDTNGGVAPSSCTPGSPLISVKYAAQYWLYN